MPNTFTKIVYGIQWEYVVDQSVHLPWPSIRLLKELYALNTFPRVPEIIKSIITFEVQVLYLENVTTIWLQSHLPNMCAS